ncbi:MAG: response regulator transcription factor [Rhodobacteraceae bacterium]|nr:response regulator transcription factor [Paracoccaceae bacterium]MYF45579.1 response regulator transcription factor [Paracoccaceae bacterium]MYG09657.1 response regulator transcription factor [Paracoccaceae bacterium]MYI91497.1 response regulator transcription factor [Paracoccaceae bacterium]
MASQPKILVIGSNRLVRDTFQDLLIGGGEFEVEVLEHISDIQSTLMSTISTVIAFVDDPDDLDILANDNQNFPPAILILSEEQNARLSITEPDEFGFVCFIKPFSYQEVLIQLQGIVTRYEIKQQVSFKLDEIVIDPSSLTLTNESGEAVRMTQKEFELLYILYKARGKTLSREYLLKEVWGYKKDIITNTLDTHIHWLRQKIEADSANPQIIVTVDGGYQIKPEFSSQIL